MSPTGTASTETEQTMRWMSALLAVVAVAAALFLSLSDPARVPADAVSSVLSSVRSGEKGADSLALSGGDGMRERRVWAVSDEAPTSRRRPGALPHAPAGDLEYAKRHPEEYVGGNPWWPRAPRKRGTRATGVPAPGEGDPRASADPAAAVDPTSSAAPGLKDIGEVRPWLQGLVASGDDHGFGRPDRGTETSGPAPVGPAAKPPERRIPVVVVVRTTDGVRATVRVNRMEVGNSPVELELDLVPPGDLEIAARADGYATEIRRIRLGSHHPGGRVEVELSMQRDLPSESDEGGAMSEQTPGAR